MQINLSNTVQIQTYQVVGFITLFCKIEEELQRMSFFTNLDDFIELTPAFCANSCRRSGFESHSPKRNGVRVVRCGNAWSCCLRKS